MNAIFAVACEAVLVLCLALLCGVNVARAEAVNVNVATAYAADNFHAQNLQQFAGDVAASSSGRVLFKIHPGGYAFKAGSDLRRRAQR